MIEDGGSLEYLLDERLPPEDMAYFYSMDISGAVYTRMKELGMSKRELAERMGYNAIIQRAGGHIVSDTCIDVPPCWQPYYHGVGVTASPKCAYYNEIRDIEFIIRPIEESVQAAIDGEVLK